MELISQVHARDQPEPRQRESPKDWSGQQRHPQGHVNLKGFV